MVDIPVKTAGTSIPGENTATNDNLDIYRIKGDFFYGTIPRDNNG
jgi:hypothetical protein